MFKKPPYELIDHTADFGLEIFGPDETALFEEAATALFELVTDPAALNAENSRDIEVKGDDWPDLMVNWLRELLYLWSGREMLVCRTQIDSFSENALSASIAFDPFDPDVHIIKNEIKAVTYHQIQVIPGPKGWEATVIFDV